MRYQILLLILLLLSIIKLIKSSLFIQKRWAYLNITAVSKSELVKTNLITDSALYGTNSPFYPVHGQLVAAISYSTAQSMPFDFDIFNSNSSSNGSSVVNSLMETPYGCSRYINPNLPKGDYVALVSRGECTFEKKIQMAVESGAAAIIIYNSEHDIFTMLVRNNSIPNVLVQSNVGYLMLNYMKIYDVYVTIKAGPIEIIENNSLPSKASIYFVAIAFLIVLIVTIIWLSVYYVQKYRYYNAKKRLDNRLKKATQKALTKIAVRKLKADDKEVNETCAICLENYAVNDSIRELPCGHYFHQKDVDLWLVEHRTCPMCKINILQACGIEVNRSNHFFSQYMNFLRINNRRSASAHANSTANSVDSRYHSSTDSTRIAPTFSSSQQQIARQSVTQDRRSMQPTIEDSVLAVRVASSSTVSSDEASFQQSVDRDDQDKDNNTQSDVIVSPKRRDRRRRRSPTSRIETISEAATTQLPLETLKLPITMNSSNVNKTNASNKERRAFIGSVETTSESDSSNQGIIKPPRSSENRVFLTETEKSENEFSNIPL